MNKNAKFVLLSVASVALAACQQTKDYKEHLEDYVVTMPYKANFNILQLTDIHWNANSSTMASKRYLEKTIAEVDKHLHDQGQKIDLVELTGDQFMLANAYHITTFIEFMEAQATKYNFQYATIWGNHDRQGLYHPDWLADQFKKAEHSIYIENEDNLYGRSNFMINLIDDTNAVKWQIANLDSGASFAESAVDPFRGYDYIRDDQVDWFEKEAKDVPTIAYYHIPQRDCLTLWENRATLTNKFFKLEGFGAADAPHDSKFYEVAKDKGLKAAFMGHAHNVDWTVETPEHILIGLGVKTGPELYYAHVDPADQDPNVQAGFASISFNEKFDLIGASLVTIKDETGNFDLEHLYLNERADGDFVRWEKW